MPPKPPMPGARSTPARGRGLPGRLDVQAMALRGEMVEGSAPLGAWPRLSAECHEAWLADCADRTQVDWVMALSMRTVPLRGPQPFVELKVRTRLGLVCQRCLGPVELEVLAQRTLRFEPDEDTAAAQDATAEEDVLALEPAPDWAALVEDELLLALPVLPTHDTCPPGAWQTHTRIASAVPWGGDGADAAPSDSVAGDETPAHSKPHPFAALARLRTPPG